jgi:hypothetical protein
MPTISQQDAATMQAPRTRPPNRCTPRRTARPSRQTAAYSSRPWCRALATSLPGMPSAWVRSLLLGRPYPEEERGREVKERPDAAHARMQTGCNCRHARMQTSTRGARGPQPASHTPPALAHAPAARSALRGAAGGQRRAADGHAGRDAVVGPRARRGGERCARPWAPRPETLARAGGRALRWAAFRLARTAQLAPLPKRPSVL